MTSVIDPSTIDVTQPLQNFAGQTTAPLRANFAALQTIATEAASEISALQTVAASGYSRQVPVTGFSITIGANVGRLILVPAGTLATGTVVMPAAPVDGQVEKISSTQTVTTLAVSANAGQSIVAPPTTLLAGGAFSMIYDLALTTWYPTA